MAAEEINTLLTESAFEASSIVPLQNYLQQQIDSEAYDFVANKALLKLYTFSPEQSSDHHIALALTKVWTPRLNEYRRPWLNPTRTPRSRH